MGILTKFMKEVSPAQSLVLVKGFALPQVASEFHPSQNMFLRNGKYSQGSVWGLGHMSGKGGFASRILLKIGPVKA